MYCPNCSAELRKDRLSECWNCGARFWAEGGWKPTNQPVGVFEQRSRSTLARSAEAAAPTVVPRTSGARPVPSGTRALIFFPAALALLAFVALLQAKRTLPGGTAPFWIYIAIACAGTWW